MEFKAYIQSLSDKRVSERSLVIRKIAEVCRKRLITVYGWTSGRATPSALDRKAISGVLGMPEEELFPSE